MNSDFFALIGHVVATWGAIERMQTAFSSALHFAGKLPCPRNFRRQLETSRKLMGQHFVASARLVDYYDELCSEIMVGYRHRNLLAHGKFASAPGPEGDALLIARGQILWSEDEETYSVRDVEQVFFDLSHIAGKLFEIELCPFVTPVYLRSRVSGDDVLALQTFCKAHLSDSLF